MSGNVTFLVAKTILKYLACLAILLSGPHLNLGLVCSLEDLQLDRERKRQQGVP
jgi:hypothetical protein